MENQKVSLEALLEEHDVGTKPPSLSSRELQQNSMLSINCSARPLEVYWHPLYHVSDLQPNFHPDVSASGAKAMPRAQRFLLCNHVVLFLHHRLLANRLIAPADTSILLKAQVFEIDEPQKSHYVAEPSQEVDGAWNRLLQRQYKRMIDPSTP